MQSLYAYNDCMPPMTSRRPSVSATHSAELADAVLTASRVLVAVAARSLAEHESEVSLPQYRALVVLASRGPQRPVDLAQALGVDPSTATRMCDRLAAKKLIARRRDVTHRRVVMLSLSVVRPPAGRASHPSPPPRDRTDPRRGGSRRYDNLVRAFTIFGEAAGEAPESDWQRSWEL